MEKSIVSHTVAAIAIALPLAISAPAFAVTSATGVINAIDAHGDDGTYDTKAGFVVEIGNSATISSTTGKYCFLSSDPGYNDNLSIILFAYGTGQPLQVSDTGTTASTCGGIERAVNATLGTNY